MQIFDTLTYNGVIRVRRHLIALDLDGTLLTNDKKLTEATKEVIKELIKTGHIVVIATGRSNRLSIQYYEELALNTPLINSNGAVLHHPRDEKWGKYHTPLPLDIAMEIAEASYDLNSRNIVAAVFDYVYLDQFDERIVSFYGDDSWKRDFVIGRITEKLRENPTLMMLYSDEENIDALMDHLSEFHAEAVDHWNWGEPHHIIEVMNKDMNKAIALRKVAEHFGIPRERIIAFGDGANDLEMIDYAKVGVAMDNAIPELKQIAKYTTVSNEENGVATFLADYFKLKSPLNVD